METEVTWAICNATGQVLTSNRSKLVTGNNVISIPVQQLADGVYWLKINGIALQYSHSLIKKSNR